MQTPQEMFHKIGELFTRDRKGPALNRMDLLQLAICAVLLLAHTAVLGSGRVQRLEQVILDTFMRHRPAIPVHADIALIEIREDSLAAIGRWPWPLDYHARIIRTLSQWGARAVVLDFPLQAPALPEEGLDLKKAVEESGRVYLPVSLDRKAEKKIYVHALPVVLEPEGEKMVWQEPPLGLEFQARGLGHTNHPADGDGILRRIDPYLGYGGRVFPYLGLLTGYGALDQKMPGPVELQLPLGADGRLLINWPGRWRDVFERYSYADIVQSAQSIEHGLRPSIDPQVLRGKICIVGLTAAGASATRVNALESAVPSAAVQASILNNVLTGRFLIPLPFHLRALCLAAAGFLAALILLFFRSATAFIMVLTLSILWWTMAFFSFWHAGMWLDVFQPIALMLSLFIAVTLYDQIVTASERRRLFDLATRDGLTGLYVIRHFREILNQVVQECARRKEPVCVILVDIDNFKKINDTYGHPAGDMVLKKTAQILHSKLRSKRPIHQIDFVARYGGEEFVMLLRNVSLEEAARNPGERIREAVEKSVFRWHDVLIPVTISVGVSQLQPGEAIPDPMVHRADRALYLAKRQGKNRVATES